MGKPSRLVGDIKRPRLHPGAIRSMFRASAIVPGFCVLVEGVCNSTQGKIKLYALNRLPGYMCHAFGTDVPRGKSGLMYGMCVQVAWTLFLGKRKIFLILLGFSGYYILGISIFSGGFIISTVPSNNFTMISPFCITEAEDFPLNTPS